MARFARDCMQQMDSLTKRLEVTLGPDTGKLAIRIGIHSGPVIAGVLQGERSRFQLFGDTMNTAARMESTGVRGRIQLSSETANLLLTSGKVRHHAENAKPVASYDCQLTIILFFFRVRGSHTVMPPSQ
jgi:class 3 adenylate cyclase